jgi:hypothetical protein
MHTPVGCAVQYANAVPDFFSRKCWVLRERSPGLMRIFAYFLITIIHVIKK